MSQVTYPTALAAGFAGMLSDMGPHRIKSGLNVNGAELPFGIGVKRSTSGGTKPDGIDVPTALTDKLVGILVFSQAQNNIGLGTSAVPGASILSGSRCDVLESGKCLVKVEQDVAEGDAVYCRSATSANDVSLTQKGAFRKDADTNTGTDTAFLIKGAKYSRAASAGGVAEVTFDSIAAAV